MPATPSLRRRMLVTACAATSTTERAAARLGVGAFLPALFTQRYANMGHLDEAAFAHQLRECRTFEDGGWCAFWNAIACSHLQHAATALDELGAVAAAASVRLHLTDATPGALAEDDALAAVLTPYARLLADHSLAPSPQDVAAFVAGQDGAVADRAPAAVEITRELLRAITYFQVSAFPGGTPQRLRAYARSRRLFDALATAFTTTLGIVVERIEIRAGAERVHAYRCLPRGDAPSPAVVVTNGLEGTVQELLVPLLRYHASGLGVIVMEMPGSYAYDAPMSAGSDAVYRAVLAEVRSDPRVDADRVGIVGVSFGGYWAARMALEDPRLACAVACGAPTHRSFRPKLGMPEIIIDALAEVTGATTPIGLLRRLRALSLGRSYAAIATPLLVINGDDDTLLSTRDSVELAEGAQRGELRLYPDDDHCAMGHYREWLDEAQRWLLARLGPAQAG